MSRTQFLLLPLPVALLSVALALWLAAGPPGKAATAEQQQGTTVQVEGKEISWAPNGGCETPPSTGFATADFGISPPGGGFLYWPDQGSGAISSEACVLSNAHWFVAALATDLIDSQEPNSSIPAENLGLEAWGRDEQYLLGSGLTTGAPDSVPATIPAGCDASQTTSCPLNTEQQIASGEPSPDTTGFLFRYQLQVISAPAGTYTGSVTFTASN